MRRRSLISVLLIIIIWGISSVHAQTGIPDTTISISPRATFLLVNNDAALNATPISLEAIGLAGSDYVLLQRLGDFDNGPNGDTFTSMMGLFSKNDSLLGGSVLHRVPGAIDAGTDFTSSPAWSGSVPTDIPEDFFIDSVVVQIPDSAKFLFVAVHDSKFDDNTDPDGDLGVRITWTEAPNQSPVAIGDTFYIAPYDTVVLDLTRNDYDPDQDSIAITGIIDMPVTGIISIQNNGMIQYYAETTESVTDSFSYMIKDAEGDSSTGHVTIHLSQGLSGDMYTVTLFKFDDPDSLISYDFSMHGNHGMNSGTSLISGPFDQARYFDGIDDLVDMDQSRLTLDGSQEWTIEFVARAAQAGSGTPALVNHYCNNGWIFMPGANSIYYGIKTNTAGGICGWNAGAWLSVDTPMPIDTSWHYYALSFKSGDSLRVYFDGQMITGTKVTGIFTALSSSQFKAYIGWEDFGNSYQSGFIDEVRISSITRDRESILRTWTRLAPAMGYDLTGIDQEPASGILQSFQLDQNYPNPFNPVTNIGFYLPENEFVTLKIYNLLGEEVAGLIAQNLNSGRHSVRFDAANFASGVYYYQLVAGPNRQVKKMMLLR